MKSIIDWNEMVPKLPKKMRDDLYLEAVAILSEDDDEIEASTKNKKKSKGYRNWEKQGDGHHLAAPGRRYRIMKRRKHHFRTQWMIEIWDKLLASQNDIITYEGLASIFMGVKEAKGGVNLFIANLWARHFFEVVT